jgi:heme-degrading monooxygenase HmoA
VIVIVFRSRMREGADAEAEVEAVGLRMYELACGMPGFISYKDFVAADGENVSIVEFDSHEHLLAWRNHPEHRGAQQQGRERFFSWYHIQVCEPLRDYSFP